MSRFIRSSELNPSPNRTRRVERKERERLIHEFAPVIKYIAQRIATRLPPYISVDDLINAGVIGLYDAMEKYDSSRDNTFKTYAKFRIRGAMLDELRGLDWVPRAVRQKESALERAEEELERRLGRSATDEEVATSLNITLEKFYGWQNQVKGVSLLSLETHGMLNTDGEAINLLEILPSDSPRSPEHLLKTNRLKAGIARAIEDLPYQKKVVISLHYFYEELTMKEIGEVLGVTESRVSQIHAEAIRDLKRIHPELLEERYGIFNTNSSVEIKGEKIKEMIVVQPEVLPGNIEEESVENANLLDNLSTLPEHEAGVVGVTAPSLDSVPVTKREKMHTPRRYSSHQKRVDKVYQQVRDALVQRKVALTYKHVEESFPIGSRAISFIFKRMKEEGIIRKSGEARNNPWEFAEDSCTTESTSADIIQTATIEVPREVSNRQVVIHGTSTGGHHMGLAEMSIQEVSGGLSQLDSVINRLESYRTAINEAMHMLGLFREQLALLASIESRLTPNT